MPVEIDVTSEQIEHAENILLDEGEHFDEERREFIKNFTTIDLQAVPGSGKTTALLAKLLILEDYLPLNDGGVLVISHTNSAIDEIKDEIRSYCPKLFKYPNFVGTIQSFVNKFLAIPFGNNSLETRIHTVDTDVYQREVLSAFYEIRWDKSFDEPGKMFYGRQINKAEDIAERTGKDKSEVCNELIDQEVKDLYYDYSDDKVRLFRDNSTIISDQNNLKFKGLKQAIESVVKEGIISYEYAYKLGFYCLERYPDLLNLLQNRFNLVFVDEMQDMNPDQYELLEKIFFDEGNAQVIYQRIGDKNQSIYNGNLIQDEVWVDRETVLSLTGSHRLNENVANIVSNFAINSDSQFEISGLKQGELKPHLLVYDDPSIESVIGEYADIISEYQDEGLIPINPTNPFKVIAWNTEWKNDKDRDDPSKIRLVDYYPEYEKDYSRPRVRYSNLKSYLYYYDNSQKTLASIRKNILNGFLQVLKLESVTDEEGRYPTKRRLLNYLAEQYERNYNELKLKLYKWSIGVIRGNEESVLESIRAYLPGFLEIFDAVGESSCTFVNSDDLENKNPKEEENNNLIINGIVLEPATVHSSKGQTHTTTLYLESYYNGDYESSRLSDQILGEKFSESETRTYHQYSTLMSYVGLSRPSHLLCLAVHKDRFEEHLSDLDEDLWEVIEVD